MYLVTLKDMPELIKNVNVNVKKGENNKIIFTYNKFNLFF